MALTTKITIPIERREVSDGVEFIVRNKTYTITESEDSIIDLIKQIDTLESIIGNMYEKVHDMHVAIETFNTDERPKHTVRKTKLINELHDMIQNIINID